MKRNYFVLVCRGGLLLLAFIFLATPVFAVHPDEKSEIENLKSRIIALEKQKTDTFSLIGERIKLSGLIQLEAYYTDPEGAEVESDVVLATTELVIEAAASDAISGHVTLLYEEEPGGNEGMVVDEAVISMIIPGPVFGQTPVIHAGKMYLPFGKFNSFMISDPLTVEVGETQDTAILVAFEEDLWNFSVGVFSGDTDVAGDKNHIDSWVAYVEVMAADYINFGASFISDLGESDSSLVQDTDPPTLYLDDVAGMSAFLTLQYAQLALEIEYLAALDDFDLALVGLTDLTGTRPEVWNLELAWMVSNSVQVAARYEEATDFQDDMQRYGVTASCGIYENAVIALEYLKSDPELLANSAVDTITAQLAFEF